MPHRLPVIIFESEHLPKYYPYQELNHQNFLPPKFYLVWQLLSACNITGFMKGPNLAKFVNQHSANIMQNLTFLSHSCDIQLGFSQNNLVNQQTMKPILVCLQNYELVYLMTRKIDVELNLADCKINCVSLNFIPPTL